jgi:hypothetical protein
MGYFTTEKTDDSANRQLRPNAQVCGPAAGDDDNGTRHDAGSVSTD